MTSGVPKNVTIKDFVGTMTSGLAILVVQEDDGKISKIPCDNGPTVRALASLFAGEDVIGPGHTVDVRKLIGKRLRIATNDLGLLAFIDYATA